MHLIEEQPHILLNADEPIYQLSVLEDTLSPTILAASKHSQVYILSRTPATNTWECLSMLSLQGADIIMDTRILGEYVYLGDKGGRVHRISVQGVGKKERKAAIGV